MQRAKWLTSLYEKFYERPDLKGVREALDCEGGESPSVDKLVIEEPAEFTDYLNFFDSVHTRRGCSRVIVVLDREVHAVKPPYLRFRWLVTGEEPQSARVYCGQRIRAFG